MSEELKPCPFCGGTISDLYDAVHSTGVLWQDNPDGSRGYKIKGDSGFVPDGERWKLRCLKHNGGCGCSMSGDSRDQVIERWNRRADGWQPIETAPKVPFSRYLLLDDKGYVTIGEWVDWDSTDQLISPKSKSRWENTEGFPINAVMWMPLPAPPEVTP